MNSNKYSQLENHVENNPKDYFSNCQNHKYLKYLMLVLAVIIAFIIGRNSSEIAPLTQRINNLPTPTVTSVTKRRLLLEKDFKGNRIRAYRLNDDLSEDVNAGVFIVTLESGQYHPTVFSVSSSALSEDGLFEIVGSDLWVVNGQTNKIDIYNIELSQNSTDSLNHFTYKKSTDLPKYYVGVIDSIKCDGNGCTVNSAFHQESACTMILNPDTTQYSNIKCNDMSGEFTPKPF